ncbi:MAG: hypothetical protein ACRETY_11000 [Steroidobacteraceae bacterium]
MGYIVGAYTYGDAAGDMEVHAHAPAVTGRGVGDLFGHGQRKSAATPGAFIQPAGLTTSAPRFENPVVFEDHGTH